MSSDGAMAVALLIQNDASGQHLRDGLMGQGVRIVYESLITQMDRAALEASGARAVVVNLDSETEPLETVYELLEDERYNVVFNDGNVSSHLSGWEQSRWVRHLVAKLLGVQNTDPPRPIGVEPALGARLTEAALTITEKEISSSSIDFTAHNPIEPPATESLPPTPDVAAPLPTTTESSGNISPPQNEEVDFSDLDMFAEAATFPETEFASIDFNDLSVTDKASVEELDTAAEESIEWSSSGSSDAMAKVEEEPIAESVVMESDDGRSSIANSDTTAIVENAASIPAPIKTPIAPAWDLAVVTEEATSASPKSPETTSINVEKPTVPEAIGIEKTVPHGVKKSALILELEPIHEGASAPLPHNTTSREAWLDHHATPKVESKLRRVWVLGASIGGPEAVREFLAGVPANYPALFLLAQHIGTEFMNLMTTQLAKATALTVRTPAHGERVGHGEVIVVPATHRLLVNAEGVVRLEEIMESSAYTPSIDQVLQDAADQFGSRAAAIVFSGMASDAVEGCRYLASKGGVIYAQDPATCVVSSMVDGAQEAGVVSFTGSPRQLAEKLLAEVIE